MTPEEQARAILKFLRDKCGWDINNPFVGGPSDVPDPEVVKKLAEWLREGGLK